jgi:predicted nucleic acid-binding protein
MVGAYPADKADRDKAERYASSARIAGCAMIVLDASVVVELLSNGALADSLRRDLVESSDSFIVPHLLDVEAVSALRNMVAGRRFDAHRSGEFLAGLAALPAERYSHIPVLGRMWELRHNFTAYDAAYIALAEATDSVLYTCDEKLCKGHRARVALFTQ